MILGIVFFGTVFFSIEFAILAGVLLSLMIFLRKTSRPRLSPRLPDPDSRTRKFIYGQFLPECPQLKILRLDDALYFGSVSHVGELFRRYREHYPEQKHLFLLTKGISQVDLSGAELLINEARERRKIGGEFYMYRLRDTAAKVFERGSFQDEIGEANIFDTRTTHSPRFSSTWIRIFARPAKTASLSNAPRSIKSSPNPKTDRHDLRHRTLSPG